MLVVLLSENLQKIGFATFKILCNMRARVDKMNEQLHIFKACSINP